MDEDLGWEGSESTSSIMQYNIKFRPDPGYLIFETLRYFTTVRDIIQIVQRNFKILHRNIMVYDKNGSMLSETDPVKNGNTYMIKCTRPKRKLFILFLIRMMSNKIACFLVYQPLLGLYTFKPKYLTFIYTPTNHHR